ncbi:DUF4198 domain-containing protein [Caulobacter sp. LARHSG274]
MRFRIRTVLTALALVSLTAAPAAAHDFWVQPQTYWPGPGATTSLSLQVGHAGERQRSAIRRARITSAFVQAPDGRRLDLGEALHPGGADDGDLRLTAPGLHVLALETDTRAQSHQPAARFNAYLVDEGLTPAIEARRRLGRTGVDGAERYGRISKALIQVGPVDPAAQRQALQPLGLALEIVPERSPYAGHAADLPVRVFYQGRPLAGALVKLTDLAHDAEPVERHRTDAAGRARFSMPSRGAWLLNVVWTRPLPASEEVDFETLFSSLSFGFPAEQVAKDPDSAAPGDPVQSVHDH